MKPWLAIPLMAVLLFLAEPVSAWECQPGVPDTKENQDKGLCVEVKIVKKHHKKVISSPTIISTPISTPVPITPPVVPSISTSTLPVTTSQPANPTDSQPMHQNGQVCVYEPTTNQWEIRRHFGDHLESNQRWPIERDLCEQDRPVPARTQTVTATPVAIAPTQPRIEATPMPEPIIGEPYACVNSELLVPIYDEAGEHMLDAETGYPMWLVYGDESGEVMLGEACPITPVLEPVPVIVIPEALPDTGDGSTYGR